MRPSRLDDVIGQDEALSVYSPLRAIAKPVQGNDGLSPSSIILTGPPGVGKTTIAKILASQSGRRLVELSATSSTVKDVKNAIEEAKSILARTGQETILFVDEIHRFTKTQQDSLLPGVENRDVTFIAATTENPSYSVIKPLLSRSVVVTLHGLDDEALTSIVRHAIESPDGLDNRISLDDDAVDIIVSNSNGDARKALGLLELISNSVPVDGNGPTHIPVDDVADALGNVMTVVYDRNGDDHYDMVSAFIKSMRGSDAQAAVYWAARMLDAGEDPMFIARRVMIAAAEEVGLANPQALTVAASAAQAVSMIGMPEARIILSEAIIMVATSPKSNASYQAMNTALDFIHDDVAARPVPLHLRNATNMEKSAEGYGEGYRYSHDYPYGVVEQQYLPDGLQGTTFYTPKHVGQEKDVIRRMDFINSRLHPKE